MKRLVRSLTIVAAGMVIGFVLPGVVILVLALGRM